MNSQRRDYRWKLQKRAAPYLFLSPFVLLFCVFLLYPLVRSLVLSLYKTAGRERRFSWDWEITAICFFTILPLD